MIMDIENESSIEYKAQPSYLYNQEILAKNRIKGKTNSR